MVNVKDAPFGATGDGATDDTNAIQAAINYAKGLTTPGGGSYRATVFFPAGSYYITQPINITNATGILLKGDGDSYLNSIIVGNTSAGNVGRAMFDFTGATLSGCDGFTFLSLDGYTNRSTIGIQFALTNGGGLNCGVRNCYFQMGDVATANNNIGTIGILNIRSEEFYVHECLIRTNAPIILSFNADLSELTGLAYTATSKYQTLSAGTGSMGVVSIKATSLQTYEKRQPALLLNGTNSVNFQGYIGRTITLSGNSGGTNETAIYCNSYNTNLLVHGTIESYSRVLKVTNAGFDNNEFNVVVANQSNNNVELFDVTNCNVRGLKVKLSGPAGQPNRYVIYHAPQGGGNQGISTSITNSEIICPDVPNQYMISPNLLKTASNLIINSNDPFEKRGGRIRQLYTNKIALGTVGSVTTANIFRFQQANLLPFNNANAGYYRIWIDGIVQVGSYGSGNTVTLSFQAQVLVNQQNGGAFDPTSVTIIILDKSGANPAAVDITGLLIDVVFSSNTGAVTLTPKTRGTATFEPVFYNGHAEIMGDFGVNDPIPLR